MPDASASRWPRSDRGGHRSRSGLGAVCECATAMAVKTTTTTAANLPAGRVTQRMSSRFLLRLLLGRSFPTRHQVADLDLDDEAFIVIRPDLADDVVLRKL